MGWWESWYSVPQNCCVAPLQQNPKPPPEVPDCLPLLLSRVPRQRSAQLHHLPCGHLMPPTKGLHCQWDKVNTLSPAFLSSTINFPLKGKLQCMPRIDGPSKRFHLVWLSRKQACHAWLFLVKKGHFFGRPQPRLVDPKVKKKVHHQVSYM